MEPDKDTRGIGELLRFAGVSIPVAIHSEGMMSAGATMALMQHD